MMSIKIALLRKERAALDRVVARQRTSIRTFVCRLILAAIQEELK